MTTSPADSPRAAQRPGRLVVALGLVLAVVAVALGSVLDAHASSGPAVQRRDAVAASPVATGDVVAPLQRVLPGQHQARAPNDDRSAVGSRVAPNTAGGGARFVVNSAGDALDTARITIPEGKFGYLLNNPSKSGVFSGSMGFTQGTLDPALRVHLVDNFGTATSSVPMVGGGTKFSVTGPLIGPSGQKWTITSAWGVDPNGTIRLITATP